MCLVSTSVGKFSFLNCLLAAWVLGVIGSILIAGLIMLLIWKVCTTVHDRREYARFENERKKLKWHRNDNPLYKEATSTFANPLYGNSSKMRPRTKM
jgi:integrin beta 1